MTFAPPVKTKLSSRLAKSSWTPLSNPSSNNQVFEERREIMQKWFSKWQDGQKKIIVGDIVQSLSQKHLYELHEKLNAKFPQEKFDFTKRLPRVLSLYLFSFLDPRSLCRCAQVSWYWNYLTELDSLWRPKCLKFGWYPTYQPSPHEEKIWKRFYVKTVHDLNYAKPKPKELEVSRPSSARSHQSSTCASLNETTQITLNRTTMSGVKRGPLIPSSRRIPSAGWEPPPWRGSDPNPVDTVRFNVLDNKSKYKGKSKRSTSAMNTSRSLNTGRPKSSARSTKSGKRSTKLNDSLDRDVINKNGESNRSIKTSSRKGSVCDPFEDHGISRLSIDSGKRPRPVVKLERPTRSPNATFKESSVEERSKAESVKSSMNAYVSVKAASLKSEKVSRRSSVVSNAKSSIVQKLMAKEAEIASLRSASVVAQDDNTEMGSVRGSVKSEKTFDENLSGEINSFESGKVTVKSENASVKSEKSSGKSTNVSLKSGIVSGKDEHDKNESVSFSIDNDQASVKSEKKSVICEIDSVKDEKLSVKSVSVSLQNVQASVKSETNSVKSGIESVKDRKTSVKSVSLSMENDQVSLKSEKDSVKSDKVSIQDENVDVDSEKNSVTTKNNEIVDDKFSVKMESSGLNDSTEKQTSVANTPRSSKSGKQRMIEAENSFELKPEDDDVIREEIVGDVSTVSSHVAVDESISNLHGKGWKIQASDDEDF